MKKLFLILTFVLLLLPLTELRAENSDSLAEKLSGRILLQVESYGRAWYLNPQDKTRYYLRDGDEAYNIMRHLSLGITNADLAKIPTKKSQTFDSELVERLKGYILLQVESRGEAWYLNPTDGLRYYLKDGPAAYNLMREMSLGITNANLEKIPINNQQVVADYAFSDVAYVAYDGEDFTQNHYGDTILPLASLTKLMTALVFLDSNPTWHQIVAITFDQINYPKYYVGNDVSSEINLAAGDQISIDDLWTALLVASSNQSAATLADASGYSREDFIVQMNLKAQELELTKTHFVDVAGLDAHNISTPKEMAIIARAAFAQAKIAGVTQSDEYIIQVRNKDKTIPVINRNYSLMQFKPDAAKTGFLVEAQRNLALQKNSQTIVILHARSMNERNEIIKELLE